MKNKAWPKVAKACPDPQRADHYFNLLSGTAAASVLNACDVEQLRILAALFSGAQALSAQLIAHPDWLHLIEPELLRFPRRKQGLKTEIDRWLIPALEKREFGHALKKLREFKQMEMLRIAARDLARLGGVMDIVQELSSVAEICLDAVWRICLLQMTERYGHPMHSDPEGRWHRTPSCVLGMGKLGGQELNYSSDVDLLFLYGAEGGVFQTVPAPGASPRPTLTNHQFFNKTAELFIAEVTAMAPEGALYRVDMRLRPEGDNGPLTRSLTSYENYYAQWGQIWERMMLIKARGVAGDVMLASEFLETVQPFRFPRSVSTSVLSEVGAMKDRIEHEVLKSDELERNVKLGRGGIREIEFVVQSQQLLHAGRQPFLQGAQTLPCLEKLVQYDLLLAKDAAALRDAYKFLRDVEHRLQMDNDLQTHTIPAEKPFRERLAKLSGYDTAKSFETALRKYRDAVRRVFTKVFKSDKRESTDKPLPEGFEETAGVWREHLEAHGFIDPPKAFKMLREFVEGPGYVHVSPRTASLARDLLPRLFALCPQGGHTTSQPSSLSKRPPLSDPDRVLTRLDSFIAAYGARSTLFELWHSNPAIFELLILLFDRSEFLAELAIRTPDLVDELVASDRLRLRKSVDDTLRDLRHGLGDEDQHAWLRRYHQAELMRIGLRDILGLADVDQSVAELSALAEACLQYSLEVVMRRRQLSVPPFAIIGLGKLGGAEIDYGSDLDILFVTDAKAKDLPRLAKIAIDVTDLVSRRTEHGLLFQTDSRLRPDGEKGLLVNTLKAYDEYWRRRALLWEVQSLTRARCVAGNRESGVRFEALAREVTAFNKPPSNLDAFTSDWKQKIHAMRMRIEKERTPAGKDDLAIKTGSGGLVDAEFVAQALCLEHGWHEPNTMRALERARAEGILPGAAQLIKGYTEIRRVEAILRRWSYEGETLLPEDPAPFYRVSVRCGFDSPEAFRKSIAANRSLVREGYLAYFDPA